MSLFQLLSDNTTLFYSVVIFVGLCVGSFLNVVIYRLPLMMEMEWRKSCQELTDNTSDVIPTEDKFNLATPASKCPNCDSAIEPWQNIPVISYLLLLGKCYNCKVRIPLRYPLVELITALLTLTVAWRFGFSAEFLAGTIITWCFIALSLIDYDHQLLPDSITLPLLWLGLLASLLPVFVNSHDAIVGAAAGYIVLWGVFQIFKLLTGKEGMGFGDFKLLAAIGAWLGWQSLPTVILISSLAGSIIGLTLILITKRDKNVPIPFGPFIALAGWIYLVFNDQIQNYLPYFSL